MWCENITTNWSFFYFWVNALNGRTLVKSVYLPVWFSNFWKHCTKWLHELQELYWKEKKTVQKHWLLHEKCDFLLQINILTPHIPIICDNNTAPTLTAATLHVCKWKQNMMKHFPFKIDLPSFMELGTYFPCWLFISLSCDRLFLYFLLSKIDKIGLR